MTFIDLDTLPQEAIHPHPYHKYPKFVQAITTIPTVIKSPSDLQTCEFPDVGRATSLLTSSSGLSTLPLNGVSSMLTTLDCKEAGIQPGPKGAQGLDAAGYESVSGDTWALWVEPCKA